VLRSDGKVDASLDDLQAGLLHELKRILLADLMAKLLQVVAGFDRF
jgi:hypothetical protein